MISNLGFTLTPDSMLSFKDATWPLLVMTFLAFAGNTCYPVLLRLVIWTMHKVSPKQSTVQEPLRFLLDHPRRCYTLLFPGKTTWILFAILFILNFVDVVLIIVLDLHNESVTDGLPPGPRVLAALFQAASSRHTGTSTFVSRPRPQSHRRSTNSERTESCRRQPGRPVQLAGHDVHQHLPDCLLYPYIQRIRGDFSR